MPLPLGADRPPAATIHFPSGDQASCGTPKTGNATSLRRAPLTVDMSEITHLTHRFPKIAGSCGSSCSIAICRPSGDQPPTQLRPGSVVSLRTSDAPTSFR